MAAISGCDSGSSASGDFAPYVLLKKNFSNDMACLAFSGSEMQVRGENPSPLQVLRFNIGATRNLFN